MKDEMHVRLVELFDRTHAASMDLRTSDDLVGARMLLDAASIILAVAKRRNRREIASLTNGEVEDQHVMGFEFDGGAS